jgi:hypothetical protein
VNLDWTDSQHGRAHVILRGGTLHRQCLLCGLANSIDAECWYNYIAGKYVEFWMCSFCGHVKGEGWAVGLLEHVARTEEPD